MAKSELTLNIFQNTEEVVSEILRSVIRLRNYQVFDETTKARALELLRQARGLVENPDGTLRNKSVIGRNLGTMERLAAEIKALHDQIAATLQAAQNTQQKGVEQVKQLPQVVTPARVREARIRPDLGLTPLVPDFGEYNGLEIIRPVWKRERVVFEKATLDDLKLIGFQDGAPAGDHQEVVLMRASEVEDTSPSHLMCTLAHQYGVRDGEAIRAPFLVIEVGGLEDNPWADFVVRHGVLDQRSGKRWLAVDVSAAGQRQGKLFLWPEDLARQALKIETGKWYEKWVGAMMVPSKAVSYIGLGYTSLVYRVPGEKLFKFAKIRLEKDVRVLHRTVKAIRDGLTAVVVDHEETVTDGLIAVGSSIMRRLEKLLGFPPRTLHAVQVRGGLGTGIKGLMVEYPELSPETVIVFESASKLVKDEETVRKMLTEDVLGIARINRLMDSLTGITTLSKQVLGLLAHTEYNALSKAERVADWVAERCTEPEGAKLLLGVLGVDEEGLQSAIMDAAKDRNLKKAALILNPELALRDRAVRRFVADLLVDKVRRQGDGNLLVNGFDLWQAPDPLIIKAVEVKAVGEVIEAAELPALARRLGMRYLEPDQVLWAGAPRELEGRKVALIRHPLQHPAQFGLGRIVKLENDYRWGVIFLPASGLYQATMGGSDYDGDEIKVVVDDDLVSAIERAKQSMDYIILPPNGSAEKVEIREETYPEVRKQVLLRALQAVGQIGILSNLASTASALIHDPAKREKILSVLAFLVMVAVDAVKTGIFPDPASYLQPDELEGTPFEFRNGRLRVRRVVIASEKLGANTRLEVPLKAVWLGQLPEVREAMAKLDRTAMGPIYMRAHELAKRVQDRRKDTNDESVTVQLLRVARTIVPEPMDLKPLAQQIVALMPDKEWDTALNRLENYRAQRMEAKLCGDRLAERLYTKAIEEEKIHLSSLMAEPVAKARELMKAVGPDKALALAAVVYSVRPSAAWSFCGPELVELFGRALEEPKVGTVLPVPPHSESVKVIGLDRNGLTPQRARELVMQAGRVEIKSVQFKGGWVHRVFVGDQCVGQVSPQFEDLAFKLASVQRTLLVDPTRTFIQGKALIIKFLPPQVPSGFEIWTAHAEARIRAIWLPELLEELRRKLLHEFYALQNPPIWVAERIKKALNEQREAIQWALAMEATRTPQQLYQLGCQMKGLSLSEPLMEALRARYVAHMKTLKQM